jgi:hypothetical protein
MLLLLLLLSTTCMADEGQRAKHWLLVRWAFRVSL